MKKVGCHNYKSEKNKQAPWKIWVHFTGYLSNHFSGCRLNGRETSWLTDDGKCKTPLRYASNSVCSGMTILNFKKSLISPDSHRSQELKIHIMAQDASVYYSVVMMMIPNQIGVVPRRTMYMISKECLMGPKSLLSCIYICKLIS